jgi:AcrR family transcriptional regulator
MPNPKSPSVAERKPRGHERLQRLRRAARTTFAEKGFHGATIHEICGRADVGVGTFYTHFDSKAHLIADLVDRRGLAEALRVVEWDLIDAASTAARLRRFFADPEESGFWRAWLEAVLDQPDLEVIDQQIRRAAEATLAEAIAAGPRKHAPARRGEVEPIAAAWSILALIRDRIVHPASAITVESLAAVLVGLASRSPRRGLPNPKSNSVSGGRLRPP